MGRKKKEEQENKKEKNETAKMPKFDIAGDAKRSVVAVFLFALALIIVLGFFDKAGMVGKNLGIASGVALGWAKLVFPLFLVAAGVVLLLRKETAFYISKLLGLLITLIGLAGLLHWIYGVAFGIEKMIEAAATGSGGGYAGYAIANPAIKYAGTAGGLVIILALFLVGFIIAFNFSIIHFFKKIFEKEKKIEFVKDAAASEQLPEVEKLEKIDGNAPIGAQEDEKNKQKEEDENIGKVEFVEGPDRFDDGGITSEISRKKMIIKNNREDGKKNNTDNSELHNATDNEWVLPPLSFLEKGSGVENAGDTEKNAEIIEKTLKNFGIDVERGEMKIGPSVTQYSFRPAVGIKISKILGLSDNLALALAAHPIRIEAPIPGKSLIGVEVPNKKPTDVRLRDVLESSSFAKRESNLMVAFGKDVSGEYFFGDLAKMPHLMIAGATNTGKSVCVNSIITTLLYQNSPEELKFIMVDPKRVELSLYNGIPHLLADVIVENKKVINILKWAVGEMERRYRLLQDTASRDIVSYIEKIKKGEKKKFTDPETGKTTEEEYEKLPYIVIIIDELADLMGSHGKEVEGAIIRIAQMARAVGIHLIVSTQRPEVKVITGLIKANITTRIGLKVATQIDSRTILDMAGAEKLLGKGDMLYLSASFPKPKRVQGALISEEEVKRVVKFLKAQKKDTDGIGEDIAASSSRASLVNFSDAEDKSQGDEMYKMAEDEVMRTGKASASFLQRRLRVGYARAARLLDILEDNGIVGPADGAKPREVFGAKNTAEVSIDYEKPENDQLERDKWQI